MAEQKLISTIVPGMSWEGYSIVRTAEVRTDKRGMQYLDMTLADRSGTINAKQWNVSRNAPQAGMLLDVTGSATEFNGRLQFNINFYREVNDENERNAKMSLIVPSAPRTAEDMLADIRSAVASFKNNDLRKIVEELLTQAGDRLVYYPAAQRMHHAERSGLLHHTTDMLHLANQVIGCYPFLNADLLRAGVILHDLGKIDEMAADQFGTVSDYTRDGNLVGHIVRGAVNIRLAAERVGVTGEAVVLLEHMLLSHHGIPEYGSPIRPMFPEAEVLHVIDSLDARMNEMESVMNRTPEGAFSEQIKALDNRRLYHARYTEGAE